MCNIKETMHNYIKCEFASLPENVGLARVIVASFASQLDMDLNELEEIKVAISEAVSNSIIHGYENKVDGTIYLEAMRDNNNLIFIIKDEGIGINNVEQALEPAFTTNSDRMGLGFVFMKSFMNDLEVKSTPGKGTVVTMVKCLKAINSIQQAN